MDTESTNAFGVVVRDHLIAKGITRRNGNPDWRGFALVTPDVSYETIRKAVTGERSPGVELMETVAVALDIEPGTFAEYRLWRYRRGLDPSVVGLTRALENYHAATAGCNGAGTHSATIG